MPTTALHRRRRAPPRYPAHHLVAAVGGVLGHVLQLSACWGLEAGADVGDNVARAAGQAGHFAAGGYSLQPRMSFVVTTNTPVLQVSAVESIAVY